VGASGLGRLNPSRNGYIAPLNEACAKVFAIMAVEPNMITPFDEMSPFENVFIVGAAPDEPTGRRQDNSSIQGPSRSRQVPVLPEFQ